MGETNLTRREPEWPFACRVLAEDSNHALKGAQDGTVHDDGAIGGLSATA